MKQATNEVSEDLPLFIECKSSAKSELIQVETKRVFLKLITLNCIFKKKL